MQAMTNIVLLLLLGLAYAEDCLGRNEPFTDDAEFHSSLPSNSQVIITSYKFLCKGNITDWWLYIVQPNSMNSSDLSFTFKFQVWRPSESVETNGCYRLVGENVFKTIVSSDGMIWGKPDETDIINVTPGDVVGYYVHPTDNNGEMEIGRTKLDEKSTNETVWYHTNTKTDYLIYGSDPCYFAVGHQQFRTLKSFTSVAPIISLHVVPQTPFFSATTTFSSTDAEPSHSTVSTIASNNPLSTIQPSLSTVSTIIFNPEVSHFTETPPVTETPLSTIMATAIPPLEGPISPPTQNNWWWILIAAIVTGVLLLILLIFFIIIILRRRRKREREKEIQKMVNQPEPIYDEIDNYNRLLSNDFLSSGIEVVLIEVEASESYAMLNSNSLVIQSYGTEVVDRTSTRKSINRI